MEQNTKHVGTIVQFMKFNMICKHMHDIFYIYQNLILQYPPKPTDINILKVLVYRASYHQLSNISRTLVGNKIVDHSDVVGASPTGDAPSTSSLLT